MLVLVSFATLLDTEYVAFLRTTPAGDPIDHGTVVDAERYLERFLVETMAIERTPETVEALREIAEYHHAVYAPRVHAVAPDTVERLLTPFQREVYALPLPGDDPALAPATLHGRLLVGDHGQRFRKAGTDLGTWNCEAVQGC